MVKKVLSWASNIIKDFITHKNARKAGVVISAQDCYFPLH